VPIVSLLLRVVLLVAVPAAMLTTIPSALAQEPQRQGQILLTLMSQGL
jgi:hypothetical protein